MPTSRPLTGFLALGIILGLGLWTIVIILAVGNIIGCGLFGLFTLMGHKTGVDQMVLSRAAFGRTGAYLPILFKAVLAAGFVAIDRQGFGRLSAGRTPALPAAWGGDS